MITFQRLSFGEPGGKFLKVEPMGLEIELLMERLTGGGAKPDSLMALLNLTMRGRVYFWQRRRRKHALLTNKSVLQLFPFTGNNPVYSSGCQGAIRHSLSGRHTLTEAYNKV